MPEPICTVVIPCYNHGEFLADAVASVLSAGREDVELIVVDDGSTDDSTKKAMDKLRSEGVRVLRQENGGLAAARNAGIEAGSGKYILPLDADNRIRPEYFELGISRLEANPKVGVVYGDAEYMGDRSGRWRVGPFNKAGLLRKNYIDACAMYRRSIWEETGGYDGDMPVQGYEDWNLWLSAMKLGWEFEYVPEILFEYRVAAGSMLDRAAERNKEVVQYVARKHGDLYRDAWLGLDDKRRSFTGLFRMGALHALTRLRQLFR